MSDEDASVISVDTSGEHDMEDNPALKPQLTHFYPLSSEKGSKYSLHTVPEVVPQNEDGGTGAKPFQSPAFKKKTKRNRGFGARRAGEQKSERAAFDYEDKYPEDPIYEETAPTARVWRTYLDKSQRFDADIVSDWRDTVDILLVFAGLFSAVVSAFAVQFSQNLQPDYNQISAYLLFEFISIQQAVSNGNSLDLPLSSMDRRANFNPATSCMGERAVVHQSRTESFSGSRICFGEAMAPPLYEASIWYASGTRSHTTVPIHGSVPVVGASDHWSPADHYASRLGILLRRPRRFPWPHAYHHCLDHRWDWGHSISSCYCNECPPLLVLAMPLPHATGRCYVRICELFFATRRTQAERFFAELLPGMPSSLNRSHIQSLNKIEMPLSRLTASGCQQTASCIQDLLEFWRRIFLDGCLPRWSIRTDLIFYPSYAPLWLATM